MMHSEQINEIATALAAAQGEFDAVPKAKSGQVGQRVYKYADISAVLTTVLPVLSKHKLSLIQVTEIEGSAIILRSRLLHSSGQWIECEYPVCSTSQGDHQKIGAALTYARRYAASALLGVASDEDTDAEEAADPVGRNKKVEQPRQQTQRQADPKPGDKGATAALMHSISLCESEADLNAWYQNDETNQAIGSLSQQDAADVRSAWSARRSIVRQSRPSQQEEAA